MKQQKMEPVMFDGKRVERTLMGTATLHELQFLEPA